MKYSFFAIKLVPLFLAVGSLSYGAFDDKRGPSIGVQAGVAFPTLQTPAAISSSPDTGFVVGISGEIPLSRLFTLRPELSLSQKRMDIVRAGGTQAANWNTVEIPLFLKANLGTTVRPFLLVGPMAIVNFSRSVTGGGGNFNPRTLEWGAAAGAGIDLGGFFTTLRYQIGLTDVDENSADYRSRGFQLLIGFNFG
jgi:hypothetical protein